MGHGCWAPEIGAEIRRSYCVTCRWQFERDTPPVVIMEGHSGWGDGYSAVCAYHAQEKARDDRNKVRAIRAGDLWLVDDEQIEEVRYRDAAFADELVSWPNVRVVPRVLMAVPPDPGVPVWALRPARAPKRHWWRRPPRPDGW